MTGVASAPRLPTTPSPAPPRTASSLALQQNRPGGVLPLHQILLANGTPTPGLPTAPGQQIASGLQATPGLQAAAPSRSSGSYADLPSANGSASAPLLPLASPLQTPVGWQLYTSAYELVPATGGAVLLPLCTAISDSGPLASPSRTLTPVSLQRQGPERATFPPASASAVRTGRPTPHLAPIPCTLDISGPNALSNTLPFEHSEGQQHSPNSTEDFSPRPGSVCRRSYTAEVAATYIDMSHQPVPLQRGQSDVVDAAAAAAAAGRNGGYSCWGRFRPRIPWPPTQLAGPQGRQRAGGGTGGSRAPVGDLPGGEARDDGSAEATVRQGAGVAVGEAVRDVGAAMWV